MLGGKVKYFLALNGLGDVLLKNGILCKVIVFIRIVLSFGHIHLFFCAVLAIERKLTEGIKRTAY